MGMITAFLFDDRPGLNITAGSVISRPMETFSSWACLVVALTRVFT